MERHERVGPVVKTAGREPRGSGAEGHAGSVQPSEAPGLLLGSGELAAMIAHCLRCYPEEGCGLLVGELESGRVTAVHPVRNVAASAQVYTVDPLAHLRIDREAEKAGQSVIGVFHSHTHTDAWPSPTDVRQAPDPAWHYVIVSLRHESPSTRSYRIAGGEICEESVVVLAR